MLFFKPKRQRELERDLKGFMPGLAKGIETFCTKVGIRTLTIEL